MLNGMASMKVSINNSKVIRINRYIKPIGLHKKHKKYIKLLIDKKYLNLSND
jgi:hypothetical protein